MDSCCKMCCDVIFPRRIAAFLGGARAKRTHLQGQRKWPKGERRNDLQEAPPAWLRSSQKEGKMAECLQESIGRTAFGVGLSGWVMVHRIQRREP